MEIINTAYQYRYQRRSTIRVLRRIVLHFGVCTLMSLMFGIEQDDLLSRNPEHQLHHNDFNSDEIAQGIPKPLHF